jgi:IS1 family transposase
MQESKNKDKPGEIEFRCISCHKRQSPLIDTIFENTKTTLRKILLLIYFFCKKEPVSSAAIECELQRKTACRYYDYFRWVCAAIVTNESVKRIGGRGTTVELDEAYVCKRKYNRGRILQHQDVWLFGGVCRETKDVFSVIVDKRDKHTLHRLIERFVAKGTNIFTDMWSSYKTIPQDLAHMEYAHAEVNHSKNFLNPNDPDCHTQTIERNWRTERGYIPKTSTVYNLESYNFLYLYAMKFEWDDKHPGRRFDLFCSHISRVYPGFWIDGLDIKPYEDAVIRSDSD